MGYFSGNNNYIGVSSRNSGSGGMRYASLSKGTSTALFKINGGSTSVDTYFFGFRNEMDYIDVVSGGRCIVRCVGGAGGPGAYANMTYQVGGTGGYVEAIYTLAVGRYYLFAGRGNNGYNACGGSGGGSSDIRTVYNGGTTFSQASFIETASLNSRFIVAGGGGGGHGSSYGHYDLPNDRPGSGGPTTAFTNTTSTQDAGHVGTGASTTAAGLDGGNSVNSTYTGNGGYGFGGSGTGGASYTTSNATYTGYAWPNGGSGSSWPNGGGGGGWYGGAANWPQGGGGSNYLQSYGSATLVSTTTNSTANTKNLLRNGEFLYQYSYGNTQAGVFNSRWNAAYLNGGSTLTYNSAITNPSGGNGVLQFYTGTAASYTYWSWYVATNPYTAASLPVGTYTVSYWARIASGSSTNLNNNQLWRNGSVDTYNATGANPTLTTSWQRFSATATLTATGGSALEFFPFHTGSLTPNYTVYIWGFQLEQSSTATAYVPAWGNGFIEILPYVQ